jgi:hypothetical protein
VADCLWIAGLLWDLLTSIMVSLIQSRMDCIPEVFCGRLSLDWIAGLLWDLLAVLPISIVVSLIHSLMDCIPEVYCGRPSLDSRTAVGLAGNVAHIHNGQSYPLPNDLHT